MTELDSRVTKRLVFYKSAAERDIAGAIQLPNGTGDVFLASAHGQGTRFSPDDVRLSKRDSGGVRGMDLREDDAVVSIGRIDTEDQLVLCVTSDGIGKRVSSTQFPTQGRGGKGRILIRPRPGATLVQALVVRDTDSVLIATKNGHTVRIRVGDVRELGRSAMGVKLVALNEGDRVVSAAILPLEE
jgi:DNA gyrase subunit A